MDVGDEALDPVGDELDRTLEQFRQRDRRHLVGIGVHLDAERPADVLGHHPHLMLFEPEMLGEQVLHHVRSLRALIDGEPLVARVPVRHDARAARWSRRCGDRTRRSSDHGCRPRANSVRIAGDAYALEGEIVAKLGWITVAGRRVLGVGDGRQLFVADLDQLASVLGFGTAARHDGALGLALPAGALDMIGALRRRLEALEMGEHADLAA